MPRNNSGAVPPDECMVCGVHNRYPWGSHWIPGATMICDGEDPRAWKNGGPIDMSDYVREQLAALNALPGEQVRQMADELKVALPTAWRPAVDAPGPGLCERVLVGRGTDAWDPLCGRLKGHEGPCE